MSIFIKADVKMFALNNIMYWILLYTDVYVWAIQTQYYAKSSNIFLTKVISNMREYILHRE